MQSFGKVAESDHTVHLIGWSVHEITWSLAIVHVKSFDLWKMEEETAITEEKMAVFIALWEHQH